MKQPAVFLDRDGTIIKEVDYLDSLEKVELLPGVPEALSALRAGGFKLFVVTNQSGVARGYFTETFVQKTHEFISHILGKQGCEIDGFYFCPHHPTEGKESYRQKCNCRKPEPGMVLRAASEHDLDLRRSWIIGDKKSDIMSAKSVGIKAVLVLTGYGRETEAELVKAGIKVPVCEDIQAAAKVILKESQLIA